MSACERRADYSENASLIQTSLPHIPTRLERDTVMTQLLELQFSLFCMIFVGFLVRKLGLVSREGEKSITSLVIHVVLPCNIVTSFLSAPPDGARDVSWIFLISLIVQLLAWIWGILFDRHLFRNASNDEKKSLRYGMICSNAGFLGTPLAEGAFGDAGMMLASVYLLPQRVMMWSAGLAIFSGERDRRAEIRKVITHPCVIACLIGLVLMLTKWTPPSLLLAPVQTLSRCNTALSMSVIGMILSEMDLKTLWDRKVALYTLHRLVTFPLIIYLLCMILPVSPLVRGVSVLLCCMPAGATTSMLARTYDADAHFATRLVIFSTLCSIPAIAAWSLLLLS